MLGCSHVSDVWHPSAIPRRWYDVCQWDYGYPSVYVQYPTFEEVAVDCGPYDDERSARRRRQWAPHDQYWSWYSKNDWCLHTKSFRAGQPSAWGARVPTWYQPEWDAQADWNQWAHADWYQERGSMQSRHQQSKRKARRYQGLTNWNSTPARSNREDQVDGPENAVRQQQAKVVQSRPRRNAARKRWEPPVKVDDEVDVAGQGIGVVSRIGRTPNRLLVVILETGGLFWCNCKHYQDTNQVVVSTCISYGHNASSVLASLQLRDITPEDYELLCSLDAEVPPKQGMPPEFIKGLASGAIGDTCGVCLDVIDEDEDPRVLPCSMAHSFHFGCIEKWLAERKTCPLDMTDLTAEVHEDCPSMD